MVSQLGCNLSVRKKLKYFTNSFKYNCLWVCIDTFSTFLIPSPSSFKTFPRRWMYSPKHSLLQFPSTNPPWKAEINQSIGWYWFPKCFLQFFLINFLNRRFMYILKITKLLKVWSEICLPFISAPICCRFRNVLCVFKLFLFFLLHKW